MIAPFLAAALLWTAVPVPQALAEAEHAIEAGRLDQARIMIGNAIKAGAQGAVVDRLLAELAYASGDFAMALSRYQDLLGTDPANALYAERAGISAFRQGKIALAAELLDRATATPNASWRAWNARGVVADHVGDWDRAANAYAQAAQLSPDRPEVLNNMGWSMLLRGQWEQGRDLIERAAMLDPKSERIADNLELARAALSEDLPARRPGESEEEWTARLNDAGVIAALRGEEDRAVAAFTRALAARGTWFERAANNLKRAEQ